MNLTYTAGNSISDYDIIHMSGLGRGLRSPSAYEMKRHFMLLTYISALRRLVLTWFDLICTACVQDPGQCLYMSSVVLRKSFLSLKFNLLIINMKYGPRSIL